MTDSRYTMTSTTSFTSVIKDIPLSHEEGSLTRKVIRAEIIENPHDTKKSVKYAIVHQRRANNSSAWEDLGGQKLSELRGGESSKMQFDSDHTKEIFDHLANLYEIGDAGVRLGTTVLEIANEDEVITMDSSRARIIRKLLDGKHSQEIWDALIESDPDLATKIAISRMYSERKKVIEEFESNISTDQPESFWQNLLAKNIWIFGPSYIGIVGERRINIKSALDHPLISEDGYLEIVEIKKPSFEFWDKKTDGTLNLYRSKYPVISNELKNAITQANNYCYEAERVVDSLEWRANHDNIPPLKPKGIVVLGRSSEWEEPEKQAYRIHSDSLHGVSCITFDQLLARAKQSLELIKPL